MSNWKSSVRSPSPAEVVESGITSDLRFTRLSKQIELDTSNAGPLLALTYSSSPGAALTLPEPYGRGCGFLYSECEVAHFGIGVGRIHHCDDSAAVYTNTAIFSAQHSTGNGAHSELSQDPALVQEPTVEVSLPGQPHFDDLYEYYDPERHPDPLPQRQQQRSTPLSQRRPPSSQSSGARSLRRTPRLQERRAPATRSPLRARRSQSLSGTPPIRFDESGSTTPSVFQRLVSSDDYRPRRTLRLSRHTHDAILFALEAIRRGDGVNAQPLTADPLEEEARMSELVRGTVPGTAAASGRSQNGGASRTAPAAASPTEPARYRTPTDVMRERRAREARRAEEAAARLRQEEEARRIQQEQVAGVGDDNVRRSTARATGQPTQSYNIGGPQPTPSARRQENIPPAPSSTSRVIGRPPPPVAADPRLSATTQRNRTEAYEQLNVPAPAKPVDPRAPQQQQQQQPPPQPRAQPPPQPPPQSAQQPGAQTAGAAGRSRFPNAFERWEDLSAHWEGIVSSFIHRMEENANELAGKPIDRQMARQIDDLSRAGANLFHAVVELQRLRASSERKFQRWFFETRHEQEQAQERQAQLENQLRAERAARTVSSSSIEQVRAEKEKADELVREMRRELQISKEEARRAWEELGRREQEERERTIALRSGEPTLIGGVQVVPMQGLPSRQGTVQRPQTRDGPTAGAGPTTMSGQQPPQRPGSRQTTTTSLDSPGEESRQFTYRPEAGASPTVTDPFTESSRQQSQLRREPDTQFYSTPPRPTQPATSGAAIAAARAAATSGASPARTTEQPRYYQSPTAATNAQMSGALPTPARQGTGETNTSYFPSNVSVAPSEEEYHINPDGSYTRDAQGRRIPYRQAIAPGASASAEQEVSGEEGEISEELSEDDDDHAADAERERMYAAQYRQSGQQPLPPTTNGNIPRTTSGALPPIPQGAVYEGQEYERDPSMPTPPAVTQAMSGWENLQTRTHRHPTRLSDIIEEQTARTSPSRTSYISTAAAAAEAAAGVRAAERGAETEEVEMPGSSRRRPR